MTKNEIVFYTKSMDVVRDGDDLWEGRILLYNAFKKSAGSPYYPSKVTRPNTNVKHVTLDDSTPIFWDIDAPMLYRRQYFSLAAANRVGDPVIAFLRANNVNVVKENPYRLQSWGSADIVRVFTDSTRYDPHASDPPGIVMLPPMARHIWELVRFPEDRPRL